MQKMVLDDKHREQMREGYVRAREAHEREKAQAKAKAIAAEAAFAARNKRKAVPVDSVPQMMSGPSKVPKFC